MHVAHFVLIAIATFLAVSSVLIVLHELGHYLSARMFGVKAKVFSVGFGPEIAGYTDRHGTRWKIAPIPLGGYVKFHGEMHPGTGTPEEASHPESFAKLKRWKRAVVIFAGPFVNMLITAAILFALFSMYGQNRINNVVEDVSAGSAAERAGLKIGDEILTWDGNKADSGQKMIRYIKIHPGREIALDIQRDDQKLSKTLLIDRERMEDRFGNRTEIGRIGVQFGQETVKISNPLALAAVATGETYSLLEVQVSTIWQMIKGERSIDEISGPVRLAKFSGEQFLTGWLALTYFAAILSIALAFMNLLPIPGLDGGYLALYGVEGALGHDLSKQAFSNAVKFGYGCVAILFVFGLTNDLRVLMF